MDKRNFSKFVCSCIALVAFVLGALSCASSRSAKGTPLINGYSGNANKDGAQVEVRSAADCASNVNNKYELN